MPWIYRYKCSKCDLTLPEGWGYQFYVVNDKGKRIICYHPGERDGVEEVLGKAPSLDLVLQRTGFHSNCICLDCLHQFRADLGSTCMYWHPYQPLDRLDTPLLTQARDKRECPNCESTRVKTIIEMVGATCPKCNEGVIEATWTGHIS